MSRPKRHQKIVARPILARPVMQQNVFSPVLIRPAPLNQNSKLPQKKRLFEQKS